jgi:hypothetical protein
MEIKETPSAHNLLNYFHEFGFKEVNPSIPILFKS